MKTKSTAPKVIPAAAPTAKPDLPDMPTVNELATLAASLAHNTSRQQDLAMIIVDAKEKLFKKLLCPDPGDPWSLLNPIAQQAIISDAMVKLAVDVANNPPPQDKLVANAMALWKACHHRIKFFEFDEMVFKEGEERRKTGRKSEWVEVFGDRKMPEHFPISFQDFLRWLMPKLDSETKRRPRYKQFVRWFLNQDQKETAITESKVNRFITKQQREGINFVDLMELVCAFNQFRNQERKHHASKAATAKAAAAAAAKAQRSEPAKK